MKALYLISGIFLPICLVFPYHFTFLCLAMGGVIHIFSEMTYFTEEKKILRKRQTYPPIIVLGAIFLTAVGIGWYVRGWGIDSVNGYYFKFLNFAIGFYVFASIYPTYTNKRNYIFLLLGISIVLGASLGYIYPFAFAFALVHGHNLIPWVFLAKEKGKRIYIHGFLISLIIPLAGIILYIINDFEISPVSLSPDLEKDLFRHVIPSLSPFSPELLLLSFFGYSQAIHYVLWIFYIPSRNGRERFSGFLSEISFFLGYSRMKMLYGFTIVIFLFILSVILFIYYPVEWRKLYFVLSAGHVYVELPLVVLALVPRS